MERRYLRSIGNYRLNPPENVNNWLEKSSDEVRFGGKIVLPPTALGMTMSITSVKFPLIFKLSHEQRDTYCGCISFDGIESQVLAPNWVLEQLKVTSGQPIGVSVLTDSPPVGTFVKLQPQSVAFCSVSNPKAILEHALRNFDCLTRGAVIGIHYNQILYQMKVCETLPGPLIGITNCDLVVDFEPPLNVQQLQEPRKQTNFKKEEGTLAIPIEGPVKEVTSALIGTGFRPDGRPLSPEQLTSERREALNRLPSFGAPDFEYNAESLQFIRTKRRSSSNESTPKTSQERPLSLGRKLVSSPREPEAASTGSPSIRGPTTRNQSRRRSLMQAKKVESNSTVDSGSREEAKKARNSSTRIGGQSSEQVEKSLTPSELKEKEKQKERKM